MKRFMLDTNTISLLIREHPNITRRVLTTPMVSLCISVVTEGELRFGLAKRPNARKLHRAVTELLKRLDVLPWTRATAARYADVRAGNERIGKPLAPLDLMIAAHALETASVLVTNDHAFELVADLQWEDWTKP